MAMSYKEIARVLWDREDKGQANSLKALVCRIRGKLGDDGQALQTVQNYGYRWSPGTNPALSAPNNKCVRFGEHLLDTRAKALFRSDTPVPLHPKEYLLLEFMSRNLNGCCSYQELMDEVWGGQVPELTLRVTVGNLRRKLGSDSRFVFTRRRMGYGLRGSRGSGSSK